MKKALLAIGILVGGVALFLGATLAVLAAQGRLEGDSLIALNDHPLLGMFVPKAEGAGQGAGKGETKGGGAGKKASRETGPSQKSAGLEAEAGRARGADGVPAYIDAPKGFSSKELLDILEDAREARERCDREWAAIEVKQADLERLREDLADREGEIKKMMEELSARKAEFDAARDRLREEVVTIEENEDRNIRKLAELYENMKPPDTAARHFDDMDVDQAVKILARMDPAKAAKILPYITADRVKLLTEKLARFQEQRKTSSGR
jgi:flagellar motility protein MotE (MotC chaperone)